jgi:hypothetical protein
MLKNGLEAPMRSGVSVPESVPASFVHQIAVGFFHGVSWVLPKMLKMTEVANKRRFLAITAAELDASSCLAYKRRRWVR